MIESWIHDNDSNPLTVEAAESDVSSSASAAYIQAIFYAAP